MVVLAMALLLIASLVAMLHYSRIVVKKEAIEKAKQTLDGTVQCVDNILMNVEQAVGNVYFTIQPQLHNQAKLHECSRRIVETNYYIKGCAIAMKPYFFPGKKLFMAYYHRKSSGLDAPVSPVVQSETFGNTPYTEQPWYTTPMASGRPGWMRPLAEKLPGMDPIVTYSLPLTDADGKTVGIIGVDVSLSYLSHFILVTKPSANSYCTLLDDDGSFLVHPDSRKLLQRADYTETDYEAAATIKEAAHAMQNGESGYMPFRMDNADYYIFYKPFTRTAIPGRKMRKINWSAGIVYPEDDILGDYNRLLYYVFAIAIAGLLLLFVLTRAVIHHQLLPLRMLTASAQRIARGNYNEKIPYSPQKDEIGRLQNHFQQMQESLAANMEELEELKATLEQRSVKLRAAYDRVKQSDRLKTVFLHNMTNQMAGPASNIQKDVDALNNCSHLSAEEIKRLADNIQQQGKIITESLDNLLRVAEKETNKEERL
jgi:HAMP domain-containing protein